MRHTGKSGDVLDRRLVQDSLRAARVRNLFRVSGIFLRHLALQPSYKVSLESTINTNISSALHYARTERGMIDSRITPGYPQADQAMQGVGLSRGLSDQEA